MGSKDPGNMARYMRTFKSPKGEKLIFCKYTILLLIHNDSKNDFFNISTLKRRH